MASIKIHGGDFIVDQQGTFEAGVLTLPTPGDDPRYVNSKLLAVWFTERAAGRPFFRENIPLSTVMRVEAVNKEMKHRTAAAVGRGAVAAMIGGPIGAFGAVLGGPAGIAVAATSAIIGFSTTNHTSDVTFEAEFEGGRRLLATTDTATFTKLLAAAFDYKPPSARPLVNHDPEHRGSGLSTLIIPGLIGLSLVVSGMISGVPLAWGIAVGALVLIVGLLIMSLWGKNRSARNIPRATRAMFATWFGH